MVRLKDKKGAELWQLLALIFGIIVVVVMVLGFTKGTDWIFSKIGLLPGQDLETVRQGCIISAQANLVADFCSEFKYARLPEGGRAYVNCQYFGTLTDSEGNVVTLATPCSGNPDETFCTSLAQQKKKAGNFQVNTKTCKIAVDTTYVGTGEAPLKGELIG